MSIPKRIVSRAMNVIKELKDNHIDPNTLTDNELIKLKNVGKKSLPIIRRFTQNGKCACPRCGCRM